MNTKIIQAVIFDFGGVLVEWNPHKLYSRYFDQPHEIDRFLGEINFVEWNVQQDKGRPFAQAVAELSRKFPQHEHLIRAYHEYWEDSVVGPIDGSVAILKKLKQLGYSLYGLSNWSAETFPLVRSKYSFFDYFDGIVISGEAKMIKPDAEIFYHLLSKFNLNAGECLFIDDSPANINTAQRIGLSTLRFESPSKLESELIKLDVLPLEQQA